MPDQQDQNVRAVLADDAGSDSYLKEHLFLLSVQKFHPPQCLYRERSLLLFVAESDDRDYVDYGDDGDDR